MMKLERSVAKSKKKLTTMMIVESALFIMMLLSVIDGVVSTSNDISQPSESINYNTTQQTTKLAIFNRTMIHQQSNYYSQYPVQVTMPVMNNDVITFDNFANSLTTHSSSADKTEPTSFRLLLPPSGYDDTLCTPLSSTMIELLEQPLIGDIADSLHPTGLLIKPTDATDNNCTLSSIVSNVIELNRMLPESESIQYLIFPQDTNNVSYMQIDTINNNQVATNNNNIISELIRSNITIVYMNLSYVEALMTMIQNNKYMISVGCSPFLFEPESTTCNFIYQINETVNSDSTSGQIAPYNDLGIIFVYSKLGFGILVMIGFVLSCIYHRYHPVTAEEIASAAMMIEKEKTPTKLTEKQFESLPETKYTLDLVAMLKKYRNNNVTTNTTVLHDSTATTITSSMEQPTKDDIIFQVKDCLSTDMTSTTIVNDNDENKFHCSSCHNNKNDLDLEAPLEKTIQLDVMDNADSDADECGVCCPICIEEFVVDEIVIVLPKCNHIYHKHCIREWLIKKQGCCPYCKVLVIDADDVVDDDTKNNENQGISDLDNNV